MARLLRVRREVRTSRSLSQAYRPVNLNGEVRAAVNSVEVIDGDDFERRAKERRSQRKTMAHA